jgi:hypothetical protein
LRSGGQGPLGPGCSTDGAKAALWNSKEEDIEGVRKYERYLGIKGNSGFKRKSSFMAKFGFKRNFGRKRSFRLKRNFGYDF